MSQLIQILHVQLFSFFICTHAEQWSSLCQPAHNHPLRPDGKSSFSDSLSHERDVFHTVPKKNLYRLDAFSNKAWKPQSIQTDMKVTKASASGFTC